MAGPKHQPPSGERLFHLASIKLQRSKKDHSKGRIVMVLLGPATKIGDLEGIPVVERVQPVCWN